MKRKLSWPRLLRNTTTLLKGAGVLLAYLWLGAAYKLVYAQTHDVSKFERKIPLPYYQQQFLVESLTSQTWMFGPEFREYLGKLPSLGALMSANPYATLADYCRQRERELNALPTRYPGGLYGEEALADAYGVYGQGAAMLALIGAREQPRRVMRAALPSVAGVEIGAVTWPLPEDRAIADTALRLGNGYPHSPQAPDALLRAAQSRERDGRREESAALYDRIARDYPRAEASVPAAEALFSAAELAGDVEGMREYRRRALLAAERVARDRFPGRALPVRNTLMILGQRIDLSALELRLDDEETAEELAGVAGREVERLQAMRKLEEGPRGELRRARTNLEAVRNELWVNDLYRELAVGVPGPPPKPKEYAVTGRVLLDGKPFPGVEVALAQGNPGRRIFGGSTLDTRFRARTDRRGRLRIPGVPAGEYGLNLVYETQPAGARSAAVVPEQGEYGAFPSRITVDENGARLPELHFRSGVLPDTFGEQQAEGSSLRLRWHPWAGARTYRVEVLAAPEVSRLFQLRAPGNRRLAFRRMPVVWKQEVPAGAGEQPTALCPLRDIAPDNPGNARFAQWEYQVTALDGNGKVLALSPPSLARFTLSVPAQAALLATKPPVYRAGRSRPGARPGNAPAGGGGSR